MTNNKSRRAAENHSVVHTVKPGPVLADIYRGVTPDGHSYLYFVLSRVWRPQSSIRQNYSNRFYERNEMQVVETAGKACEWIRANPCAADQHQQSRDAMSSELANELEAPPEVHRSMRRPAAQSRPVNGHSMAPQTA